MRVNSITLYLYIICYHITFPIKVCVCYGNPGGFLNLNFLIPLVSEIRVFLLWLKFDLAVCVFCVCVCGVSVCGCVCECVDFVC
jgi:hypothetical protein